MPLTLLLERKLHRLLPMCTPASRLEASGVEVIGDRLFVAFDNLPQLACVPFRRRPVALDKGGFVGDLTTTGYEDLTYADGERRMFLLREAAHGPNGYEGEIVEWSDRFELLNKGPLNFAFEEVNKGFEGLAWTRRGGRMWLLALCEGNFCRGGKKGRAGGGGRIHVFGRGAGGGWERRRELRLPEEVRFEDYAGLAIDGDRVAVLSQRSGMLWVSRLSPGGWKWANAGRTYEFPRGKKGKRLYRTVEGIAWLGPRRIAAVSDRVKKGDRGRTKDQSIHIFTLPPD